jgi:sterol desaturase/sphingolipid hydroxylase (fatty acid hydroxylase superfamily)
MEMQGQSVRLFENDWLERLSHVHPLTPLLVWAPVIAWLLWRSLAMHRLSLGTVAGLAAAGLLAWTLTEYLVHRFLFHLQPRSRAAQRLVFVVHGVHHATPDDPTRLLMPTAPAITAFALLYALFWALLGHPWVEPFFAFFLVGYLAYDYTHLAVHRGRLTTRHGRFLRRWHMLHHHATPGARWGVSSPLWDHIFRTGAPR